MKKIKECFNVLQCDGRQKERKKRKSFIFTLITLFRFCIGFGVFRTISLGCKIWMSLAHPMAISIHVMASLEGRCFERFSRFWLMMGWNSCVWTLKSLPENGDYEIIFGPFFRS